MKKVLYSFLILIALVSPVFAGGAKEEKAKEEVVVVVPETEKPQVTAIATGATVMVTVNGVEITKSMVDSYIEAAKAEGYEITAEQALSSLEAEVVYAQFIEEQAKEYTEEELQVIVAQAAYQVAAQYGYTLTADQITPFIESGLGMTVQDFANSVLPQIIVTNYLEENYADFIEESMREPTEEEIIKTYNDNISRFNSDEMVRVAHIFIPLSDNSFENTAALNTIKTIRDRIASGSYSFEQAVSDFSQDSGSNTSGGVINGWLARSSEEGVKLFGEKGVELIFSLSIGQISDVYEGPAGYHIFKLVAHRNAGTLGLDDVYYDEVTVRQYLVGAIMQRFYDEVLSITLNEKLIPELIAKATIV